MSPQIKITNLRKQYGHIVAAADVSFDVEPGEIFGLLGANGAGKTTVLECLVGLKQFDSGEIQVAGANIRADLRGTLELLGASLQNSGFPDHLTPREAMWLFGSFYERRRAAGDLLSKFSLQEKADAPYHTLSVGQRQRMALALAMVNDPAVLVLDEPSSGLDPEARLKFHACLRAMKAAGKTILISTHDLREADELCDRIAVLQKGKVVAVDSPRRLREALRGRQCIRFRCHPALGPRMLAGLTGVQAVEPAEEAHRIITSDPVATIRALNQLVAQCRLEIRDLCLESGDLSDAYFQITSETEVKARS